MFIYHCQTQTTNIPGQNFNIKQKQEDLRVKEKAHTASICILYLHVQYRT